LDVLNAMCRTFAIGDIHGCFQKLKGLMDRLDVNYDRDTLIFLGDYIDRGPDSFQVVEYLIHLKSRARHALFLKGNHEEMLGDYLAGLDRSLYLTNGGKAFFESYERQSGGRGEQAIPQTHLDFFSDLELIHSIDEYIFVHAGLRPEVDMADQQIEDMLWIREPFIHSPYSFGKQIVFGHTPFTRPLVMANKIGIDTGAVYGNCLTCLELPQRRFHHH